MKNYYEMLLTDVRFVEGLNSCMNCGICTAICPAAETYKYDPRIICNLVQSKDNEIIEDLLKSETIWYCGQCMSCRTRCPRGNTAGMLIQALRSLSQDMGFFVESEKGRQQLYLERTIGQWILKYGYCLFLKGITTDLHAEQGPVWDWIQENWDDLFERLGANFQKDGPGILRKIPEEAMDEIRAIFKETGGTERFEKIEEFSAQKAKELDLSLDGSLDNDYIRHIYTETEKNHCGE
ncbi:MAG TPA: 4Fe-4S dicluster domain-containing protein [Prolixibacteraceae bacterium]|nr:4Fe-4S dicluster domain-containing protein [Prolixibacteraceae bacterium]